MRVTLRKTLSVYFVSVAGIILFSFFLLPKTTSGQTVVRSSKVRPAVCRITSTKVISQGGDQDWSRHNGLIAFVNRDKNGVFQLYTMKPNGTHKKCLSCAAKKGAPRPDRHKMNAVWDPTGRFIVLQVEMAKNPLDWAASNNYVSELFINGLWDNLYAVTPDGHKWYRLTNTRTPQVDGVMAPSFSRDGTHLLWSRMVAAASISHPWGLWRLMTARFVVRKGVPSLHDVRDITPSKGSFFEAQGFSPDGRSVLFISDIGTTSHWAMNVWTMKLAGRKLSELTKNSGWNEHARYTPDGKKIVYMSSEPYPGTWLKTELLMMNADGSGKIQLTHFNVPGYREYSSDQAMPQGGVWSADGKRLSVTLQMSNKYPNRRLEILTFAGACGNNHRRLPPSHLQ
jgi:WD40-like Beta Propeller Repeat